MRMSGVGSTRARLVPARRLTSQVLTVQSFPLCFFLPTILRAWRQAKGFVCHRGCAACDGRLGRFLSGRREHGRDVRGGGIVGGL